MSILNPSIEKPTARIAKLPIDGRGYPVPWFVPSIDGNPEFRAFDAQKWIDAVRYSLCWVCGEQLGSYKAFVLGPMCGITRTTSEPPCHLECAEWSARNCPFLSQPKAVRREDEFTDKCDSAGIQIKRNPGVTLIWVTKQFRVFNDPQGKPLITVGNPTKIKWYHQGRPATREDVEHSIDTGCPLLLEQAKKDGPAAVAELNRMRKAFEIYYPE